MQPTRCDGNNVTTAVPSFFVKTWEAVELSGSQCYSRALKSFSVSQLCQEGA